MSQENVEIVQRAFDAMNAFTRGEPSIGAFAEILGVKMEWPLRTRQRPGALGFVAWLEETRTPMHRLTFEPHEFIERASTWSCR